jgi:SulP family sulfate permease
MATPSPKLAVWRSASSDVPSYSVLMCAPAASASYWIIRLSRRPGPRLSNSRLRKASTSTGPSLADNSSSCAAQTNSVSSNSSMKALLAIVLGLGPLASQIPHTVLAGILVKVGFGTIDMSYIKRAHKGPRWDLAPMVLVLGLTVFVDLITAVAVGGVLAALAFIKKLADDQIASVQHEAPPQSSEEEVPLLSRCGGRVMLFDFGGPLSFGAAADLGHHVRSRAGDKVEIIVLDFARVPFIDVSAVRAVETIIEDANDAGKDVYFTGMSEEVEAVLHRFAADQVPGSEDKRFGKRRDALTAALTCLDEKPPPPYRPNNRIDPRS